MNVQIAGFFWYRNAEEFEQLRSIAEDRVNLPNSYASFLIGAEKGANDLRSRIPRIQIVKVEVDPEEFLAWCAARNSKVNAASRLDFANWKAMLIATHRESE